MAAITTTVAYQKQIANENVFFPPLFLPILSFILSEQSSEMQGIWDVALCAAYQTVNSVVRAVHTAGNQCLGIGTE